MKSKYEKKKVGLLKATRVLVPEFIKPAPWLFLLSCMVFFVQGVVEALQVYVMEDLFAGVNELFEGGATMLHIIISALIYALSMIVIQLVGQLANWADTKLNNTSYNARKAKMQQKMSSLEPILFEDTDILDDIEKAKNGLETVQQYVTVLKSVFLNILPYLAIVSYYLIVREPLLMLLLVVIFLPTMFQQYMIKKLYGDKEQKSAPIRRKQSHYNECITSQMYYKETRMLGAYKFFVNGYRMLLKKIIKIDIETGTKTELLYSLTSFISMLGRVGVLYLLFVFLMDGRINVAEFSAIYLSVGNIEGRLHNLFYNSFSNVSQQLPLMENYIRFLELPEYQGVDVELPAKCDIVVDNIKFQYPNQEGNALDGVSFDVKYGQTVAIVGENGSGKSTLTKLLIGYYKPDEGTVKFNGVATSDMTFASVAKHVSAVYQRYPHYALSLRENLLLGQTDKVPDEEKMRNACGMSGFAPEDPWLPKGFDTMLSREFDDGVGLSGGQVQRIAIARAFYRESSIIVLDEPTAAIDPIEEAKIYHRFAELSKDKTSFIVTHRLASVKIADKIVMMKNGKAVEVGTHEELMALNGEYRKMYDSQRQWYETEGEAKPAAENMEAEMA